MRSIQSVGMVRLDDGKHNIFRRSARRRPAPTPVHKGAAAIYACQERQSRDNIRLKSAAIWGMPVNRVRNGSFRQASKFPLVAENCRWQALHLKTRRHRYSIGSVRGSGVVIRIIGAIFDATIGAVLLLLVLIAMRRMTRCVCLSPC